jgi:hypothetical protein
MSKRLFFVFLLLTVAGFIAWLIYHRTSGRSAPARPLRSVPELEELVYRTPFDPDLELELARGSWQNLEKSMKTDQAAASESMTAYMFAAIESGSRQDIVDEFRGRFQTAATLASLPEGTFDEIYTNFSSLYRAGFKPDIQHILSIRNDLESVCAQICADDRGLQDVVAAEVAVERYLQLAYDVEIGREKILLADGSTFRFTPHGYDLWEKKLRSYGAIVGNNPEISNRDLMAQESLSSPIDSSASQIGSGVKFGRFILPDGREVIPGLRYFQDAVAAETANPCQPPQSGVRGALADSSSPDSPVDVFRRMIQMNEQGQWSESYDLMEADSRHKMIEGIKETVRQQVTDPQDQQHLDTLSDREIWIVTGRTGQVYATEIVGSETHGDSAVIRIRRRVIDSYVNRQTDLVRVNGVWKIIAGKMIIN